MKVKTINKGGNPYENGAQFRIEKPIALKRMKKFLGSYEQVGRKNIFLIDNPGGSPFYVWVVAAPSNLKFDNAINGIMRMHGQYPMYVYFTRDAATYPTTAGKTYWDAIKKVYNISNAKFKGAIMGLDNLNSDTAEMMLERVKIKLNYKRFLDATNGSNVNIQQILKEIGGLTPKKAKAVQAILELIK